MSKTIERNAAGPSLFGETVKVYRNLRTKCWSVQLRGRVVAHCDTVVLRDVRFVVSEAGRQRVLRERRKNVHAFAVGTLVYRGAAAGDAAAAELEEVSYNPYLKGAFYAKASREDVVAARLGLFADGRVFVARGAP